MATKLLMAKSPGEAIESKTEAAVFIAGGTEVNRLGSDAAAEADTLISLKKCSGLRGIKADPGSVRIGAMCTFQDIAGSDEVPAYMKEAALFMASRTKRNMATIGGNIASWRSDSYILPALLAANASVEVIKKDSATESLSLDGYREAADAEEEMLITAVIVPTAIKLVSKRYANTAQSHAVLTMSAALSEDGLSMAGAVKNAGILRFCDLEKAFINDPEISEDKIIKMVKECSGLETADDMFGSDAYKRYLIAVTAFDLHRQLAGRPSRKEVLK